MTISMFFIVFMVSLQSHGVSRQVQKIGRCKSAVTEGNKETTCSAKIKLWFNSLAVRTIDQSLQSFIHTFC